MDNERKIQYEAVGNEVGHLAESSEPNESQAYIGENLEDYAYKRYGVSKVSFEHRLNSIAGDLRFTVGILTEEKIRRYEQDPDSARKMVPVGNRVSWQIEEGFSVFLNLKSIGFSAEEILRLVQEAQGGDLGNFINEQLQKERKSTEEIVKNPENVKKLERIDGEIRKLFKELGVPLPRYQKSKVQFFGPYEDLMYGLASELGFKGVYVAELNSIGIKLSNSEFESKKLNNDTLYAYNHEKWHEISAEPFKETLAGALPSQAARKTGLAITSTDIIDRPLGDVAQESVRSLDEGLTELFNRITAERAGVFNPDNSGSHPYDPNVNMVVAIGLTLEQALPKNKIELSALPSDMAKDSYKLSSPKVLAEFLEYYTSLTGIMDFGRRMESGIGKYAYMIMQASPNPYFFRKFLEKDQLSKAGLLPEGLSGIIHPGPTFYVKLKEAGVGYDEIHQLYPFLR